MRALIVREQFVHRYQVLVDNTDASYEMGCMLHVERRGRPVVFLDERLRPAMATAAVSAILIKYRNFRPPQRD
jgi:hypothetical protein